MPIRHYAQRKHIIHSLDSLLYQLHTLSFFLAPSLLAYVCRCATQFQFSRTREVDGKRSLRFWFVVIVLVNAGSLWTHAIDGAPEGRTVMLDFVGMSRSPSIFLLLLLDCTIIFLQIILTTLAYETSLALVMPANTDDPLLPPSPASTMPDTTPFATTIPPSPTTPYSPESDDETVKNPFLPSSSTSTPREPMSVIDLRFRHLIHRLTTAAPTPPARRDADLVAEALALPLPNTARLRLARSLRILSQLQARRGEAGGVAWRRNGNGAPASVTPAARRESRGTIPGAIDSEDGDED